MKSKIIPVLKLLVAIFLLLWLGRTGYLDPLTVLSISINGYQLLGCGILLISLLLQVQRWVWLLKAQGIQLTLAKAAEITWISNFFGLILPGVVGGDVIKGYYLSKNTPKNSRLKSLSTVVLDRLVGLHSLLFIGGLASVGLLLSTPFKKTYLIEFALLNLVILVIVTVFFVFLWFFPVSRMLTFPRLQRLADIKLEVIDVYRKERRLLIKVYLISLIGSSLDTLSYWFAGCAIHGAITLGQAFSVGSLITLSNALPISPGGLGVGESTSLFLFSLVGVKNGALIMLLTRIWAIVLKLPGCLFYAFSFLSREAMSNEI